MICKEVREHQKQNGGATDLEWFEVHVESCKECQATLGAVESQLFADGVSQDYNTTDNQNKGGDA